MQGITSQTLASVYPNSESPLYSKSAELPQPKKILFRSSGPLKPTGNVIYQGKLELFLLRFCEKITCGNEWNNPLSARTIFVESAMVRASKAGFVV